MKTEHAALAVVGIAATITAALILMQPRHQIHTIEDIHQWIFPPPEPPSPIETRLAAHPLELKP